MVDACRAQGLPEPEYEVRSGFVTIVFRRPEGTGDVNGPVNGTLNGTLNGALNGTLNGALNDNQKKVYELIFARQGIQAKDIIEETGIPRDTLNKILRTLIEKQLIEHRGSKKTGGYYLKK